MSLGITWLDALVWGVITFSLLIVLHEGGHFLAARAFRIRVHEFVVGLPGPMLSFVSKRSGTRFGVTAVPLGGYVRIAGMEYGPEDALLGSALVLVADARELGLPEVADALDVPLSRASALMTTLTDWGAVAPVEGDDGRYTSLAQRLPGEGDDMLVARVRGATYRGLRTWKRVLLLAAGVLVNVAVAYAVLVSVVAAAGDAHPSTRVAEATRGAAAAGIVAGDRIVAIDGVPIDTFAALKAAVGRHHAGQTAVVRIDRGGRELTVPVALSAVKGDDGTPQVVMGIAADLEYEPVPLGEAFSVAASLVVLVGKAILSFFNPDTFGEAVAGARSVIGASEEIAKAVKAGPVDYAWLVALLSLSLGLMNCLPILPLDGGKVVLEVVERIIGKPLHRRVSIALTAAGALVLFSLIGYLMYADVARLITG